MADILKLRMDNTGYGLTLANYSPDANNSATTLTHFRHPTDEQLGQVDMCFSNYYNFQSIYFESEYTGEI